MNLVDFMQKMTKSELFSLILIIILQFVSIAAANMLIPSYSAVIEYYEVSKSLIGLPDSVFVFMSAGMAVIWGYYTDRIDRSKIVIIGAFLWSIGTTITAFNTLQNVVGFRILVAARGLTGAGMGCVIPVAASVMGDIVPAEDRSSWFGIMAILSSISNGIGQGLSSFFGASTSWGWRFPFFLISMMSIGVIVMLFFIKIPERGSQEEELTSLQDLEMEYLYQLSKKDIKKILTKKTNLAIFFQGFLGIIPGTLVVYFLTTMFSDPNEGLFKIIADDSIRLPISSIMAALVGIGYIVGNSALAKVGDHYQKENKRARTLLPAISMLFALPACIIFLYTAPELDDAILPYLDENMLVILVAIFQLYPTTIIYVISAFIGSFFSSAGVPSRNAVLIDVNLPEHRGTTTSLFALSEQVGKGITLGLSYVLLTMFSTYRNMIIFAGLFWLPCGVLWYYASRNVISEMNEKTLILKERTQLTFIDYVFELQIKMDQAIQYIFDFKRDLGKDNEAAKKKLDKANKIFNGIESVARRKEMTEILHKVHNYFLKAQLLKRDFKKIISKKDAKEVEEDIKQVKKKIDTEWEPSDIEKIEVLYDSGNLKVVESRLQRRYDLFRSISLLKEACDIFERVELLARERLVDPDAKKLTDEEEEYQEYIKDLIVKAVKSRLDTTDLRERLKELMGELVEQGISQEKLLDIIDRASEIKMPYTDVIIDLIPKRRGRREIEKLLSAIDAMFDEYDKWCKE
ncbi:MAG: MFS transporter [Candidatus Lokiarchaeota archaeon]|nr:MFS transporter [Candidatus Lokiarchaeota archaeon]